MTKARNLIDIIQSNCMFTMRNKLFYIGNLGKVIFLKLFYFIIKKLGEVMLDKLIIWIWLLTIFFLITYTPFIGDYNLEIVYGKYGLIFIFLFPIVSFMIAIVKNNFRPLNKINIDPSLFIYLLFPSLILFSTFFSSEYFEAIFYGTVLLPISLFLTLMILLTVYSKEYLSKNIFNIILFFGLLSVTIALIIYYNLKIIPFFSWELNVQNLRLFGLFGNPNRLASIIGISFVISFSYYYYSKTKKNITHFIIILLMSLSLLLAASRGAIIAALAIVIINLVIKFLLERKLNLKDIFIIIFVNISVIFLLLILMDIIDLRHYSNRDASVENRLYLISSITLLLKESSLLNILFGSGHSAYISKIGVSSHNGYIRWLIDYGLLFTVMFVIFNIGIVLKSIDTFLKEKKIETIILTNILTFILLRELTTQSFFTIRIEFVLYILTLGLLHIKNINIKGKLLLK